ncbi:ATP-binding cassette domain-containing protein [Microbulbifer variabilis]|uniref:ATP-binding cassette domain-containing protein n=1 Tax=Microbulbifer variabilis TaxID=266805 RepID=UPI0003737D36|nr:ABC transporter ATP-binding protein [Microbulbifer variabilis]
MNSEISSDKLRSRCWPASQLDSALQALARHCGLEPEILDYSSTDNELDTNTRLQASAEALDIQVEQVSCSYSELSQMLLQASPALVRLNFGEGEYFAALCGGNRRQLRLLTPTLQVVQNSLSQVEAQFSHRQVTFQRERIARLLDGINIGERRRARATEALLKENLAGVRIEGCWLLRQPAHRSVWKQLRLRSQHWQFLGMLACHATQMVFFLASWWVIGRAVLGGYIDTGWLVAWILLMASQVPLSLFTLHLRGSISIESGALLKRRLLASALRINPDRLRHMGTGQVLGRVYDAENIESNALQGSFLLVLGATELLMAVFVLLIGAGGHIYLLLLPLFFIVAIVLGSAQYQSRRSWVVQRLSMTDRLIEKMLGHRTRLAQQAPVDWHRGEDRELSNYLQASTDVDSTMVRLVALLPRMWLLFGVVGLLPVFISGDVSSAQLAVAFGGVLLGYRAVLKCMSGFTSALSALLAWENVRKLFALEIPQPHTLFRTVQANSVKRLTANQPFISMKDLCFSYSGKGRSILAGCTLNIYSGDRILLQGASGSGKSTLANIITGIHEPSDGLMLLNGYDRASFGLNEWRRIVASSPQFHENHVLGDSFLFNLLMGNEWPPTQESLRKAYAVCDELGLTPLLNKMPAGILQTVGEMGWKLSHGEMSRLFIARALLQDAELVILDESLAALDPGNLRKVINCIKKYSNTLVVIAHP